MPKLAGPGPGTGRPDRAGHGLEYGRPGSGGFARTARAVLISALLSTTASLPALAQDAVGSPTESPAVYVNKELLERLATAPPATGSSTEPRPEPVLRTPPSWQLESRLYVVPLGQAGPAEPAQSPPAPSVLTSELEALEGRRSARSRGEAAVVKPRVVPPRPAKAAATPAPEDEAAVSAPAPETAGAAVPDPAPAPTPAGDSDDSKPPAAEAPMAAAKTEDPAPPSVERTADASSAPPAPAAILGELAEAAERQAPRSSRITAPPVPEPPAPPSTATAEAEKTPPEAAPTPKPEERLGPAAPAAAETAESDTQLSARPPAEVPLKGQILFEAGSTQLSPEARGVLDGLAGRLLAAEAEAIEIRAYATGRDSRRLSLSRGLAARSYLQKQGVEPEKVFLRPLGDKAAEGPAERIDYELVTP